MLGTFQTDRSIIATSQTSGRQARKRRRVRRPETFLKPRSDDLEKRMHVRQLGPPAWGAGPLSAAVGVRPASSPRLRKTFSLARANKPASPPKSFSFSGRTSWPEVSKTFSFSGMTWRVRLIGPLSLQFRRHGPDLKANITRAENTTRAETMCWWAGLLGAQGASRKCRGILFGNGRPRLRQRFCRSRRAIDVVGAPAF